MNGLPLKVELAMDFLRLVKGAGADRVVVASNGVYLGCLSPAGELARDAAYDMVERFMAGRDSAVAANQSEAAS